MEERDFDFLNYEAEVVQDWEPELQSLVDKGMVSVQYDANDEPEFKLTALGRLALNATNIDLN